MELYLRPLMGMWRREATVYLRETSRVVASIVSPLMWIAIVGIGIDRGLNPSTERLGGLTYLEFIVPGVIAQAIMFGTLFYGLYIVWDRKMDVLKAVLVTPVPRTVIFFGKVIGGATEAIIEGGLLLILGAVFVGILWWNLPAILAVVILTAVMFTSIGLALGSFFKSFVGFRVTSTFLAFPMFFLSGALFPLEGLPAWLTWFTTINPLTYAVDALRALTVGGVPQHSYAVSMSVLAAFTVAAVVVGAWSFNRMRD